MIYVQSMIQRFTNTFLLQESRGNTQQHKVDEIHLGRERNRANREKTKANQEGDESNSKQGTQEDGEHISIDLGTFLQR